MGASHLNNIKSKIQNFETQYKEESQIKQEGAVSLENKAEEINIGQTPSEILGGLLLWLREGRNLAVWSSIGNCTNPQITLKKTEIKTGILIDGKLNTKKQQRKYTFLVFAPESEIEFLNSHKDIIEEGLYEASGKNFDFEVVNNIYSQEELKLKKMENFFLDKLKIVK